MSLTNALDVLPPLLLARGIDQVMSSAAPLDLAITCGLFLAILMATAIFRYAWRIYFGKFHHSSSNHLRKVLFRHIARMSPRFFDQKGVGELMSLLVQDIQAFRMGIGPGLLILIDAVTLSLFILPIMFYLNWEWTLKTLIFLPFVPFFMKAITKVIFKRYKHEQEKFAELSGFAQELVAGIRIVKSYARESLQTQKFDSISREYEIASNKTAKADALFRPVMEFGVASGGVILLYLGSGDVINETITLGSFVAFHRYIQRMVWPMTAIGMGVSQVQRALASFQRIKEVLEIEPDVDISTGDPVLPELKTLEIKDLKFRYSESADWILKGVNLKIEKGQTIGLAGPIGSGKSSLLKILCRLYEYEHGQILWNGEDIRLSSIEALRSQITLVPQEAFLFSNQVRENIDYFEINPSQLDQAAIEGAAKAAAVHSEILTFPKQYNTLLGERGLNLSGGQRQRLALARGFRGSQGLLLLDDTLSAVDVKTEREIIESLSGLSEAGLTLLIVSHRAEVLKRCDRVYVFRDGQVVDSGTHEELYQRSAFYRDLNPSQELLGTL